MLEHFLLVCPGFPLCSLTSRSPFPWFLFIEGEVSFEVLAFYPPHPSYIFVTVWPLQQTFKRKWWKKNSILKTHFCGSFCKYWLTSVIFLLLFTFQSPQIVTFYILHSIFSCTQQEREAIEGLVCHVGCEISVPFFFTALLRNNWHTSLYNLKAYSMMIWFTFIVKWLPQYIQLISVSHRYS